jgi:hypothetical protein
LIRGIVVVHGVNFDELNRMERNTYVSYRHYFLRN